MAAHIGQPTQSRRYIQLYLGTWGVMAVGALGYLTVLAFPSHGPTPPQAAVETPAASKRVSIGEAPPKASEPTVAPGGTSLSEVRKEPTPRQGPGGERIETVRVVVQTRQPTPEEPAANPATSPATSQVASPVANDATQPVRTSVPGINLVQPPAARPPEAASGPAPAVAAPSIVATPPVVATPPAIVAVAPGADAAEKEHSGAAATAAAPPFVPIETGSIPPRPTASASPKQEIVFGEPVVTRGGKEFAVQLGTSPSLQALKHSWGQLSERHAGALDSLQPRVIAPRARGGAYRLLAGPFASKAEAERVCSELQVGAKGCFATNYAGAPL